MDVNQSYLIASHSNSSGLHLHPPHSSTPTHTYAPTTLPLHGAVAVFHFRPHIICIAANPSGSSCTFLTYSVPSSPTSNPRKPDTRCPPPSGGGVITAISISPDDGFILAGAKSGRLYCWGLGGILLKEWDGHYGEVRCVEWGKDGEVVITGGGDGGLLVWDVGRVVALGEGDGVRVWKSLRGHSLGVVDVATGYGGVNARMVSVGGEGEARVWHIASGKCLGVVVLDAVPRTCVMSVGEDRAWIGLVSGDVVGFEVGKVSNAAPIGREGCTVLRGGEWGSVDALVFNKKETELIAGYKDGQVRIWDIESIIVIFTYRKHTGGVNWLGVIDKDAIARYDGRPKCHLVLGRHVVTVEEYCPMVDRECVEDSDENLRDIWDSIDNGLAQLNRERDAASKWKESKLFRDDSPQASEVDRLKAENEALRGKLRRVSDMVADKVLYGR